MTDAVKHMWQCLDDLRVERIDHGINVLDDERLIAAVRERNICLTTCRLGATAIPDRAGSIASGACTIWVCR